MRRVTVANLGPGRGLRVAAAALLVLAALALAACPGARTRADILGRAEGLATTTELTRALGPPDFRSGTGGLETWVYRASDGVVAFFVSGGRVERSAAGVLPDVSRGHYPRSAAAGPLPFPR
ncbi:hypothetical protein G3N55_01990 [Dissulfurirhabdus thermomarina]|uniref:Outer membrane protein assembly factor BamE n=1 Tax=Dissulfurirhabdus thermomarina TaxID=1765737 RepID=A0A6N9TNG3_DISTH|nr:hypothetical protein [Dissulfurirhabdus thermomarina]NDY41623.1 hypothetical protein [Dissulfurirhabdus thermomarina]NMX23334.1 hypothetical protein [Dissulfurirhabdus thermomarina]